MATLSIRLDAPIASMVDRIVAATGKTKSEIVREAIAEYAQRARKQSKSERPYDKMADLIGAWDSGGRQLSTKTGRDIAQMMKETNARRADRHRTPRRAAR